jgi:hypothetical protein
MTQLIQKLTQFLSLSGSISTGLDSYIASKNPKFHADVERLTTQYLNRGICGRTL